MAQRTRIELTDDIDGKVLRNGSGETVSFALDGTSLRDRPEQAQCGQVPQSPPGVHRSWTQGQRTDAAVEVLQRPVATTRRLYGSGLRPTRSMCRLVVVSQVRFSSGSRPRATSSPH